MTFDDYPHRRIALLLALLGLAIAPTVLVGVLAVGQARSAVRERVTEGQVGIANTLALDVAQDYDAALTYTRGIARRPGFISYVDDADAASLAAVMERAAIDGPYFDRLTAYDSAGSALVTFPAEQSAAPLDTSSILGAEERPRVRIGSGGRAFVRVVLPVLIDDDSRRQVGWLSAELALTRILAGIEDVSIGSTGEALLAQPNGRVLVSSDTRREGRVLLSGTIVAALRRQQPRSTSYHSLLLDRRELAAVMPVGGGDWSVIVSQSEREVFAPVRRIERVLAGAFLLTLLAAAAVAWWLSGALHRHAVALASSEERAQQANAQLQHADEIKSQFLAMASHELRTPLTAIEGFTSTMLYRWEQLEDGEKLRFLEIIDGQSHRLSRLVEDLLTLSKVESGKLQVERVRIDVPLAIKRVVRELGATSEVEVSTPHGLTVLADEGHLTQILVNFISNARKYGQPPVVITADRTNGWVEISVADQGAGVPPDFVPHLFEPFVRAQRNQPSADGTGLGLSIVKGLAQAQGGDAWYEPNDPTGSIFKARLPHPEDELVEA